MVLLSKLTEYGFTWGPARFLRLAELPQGNTVTRVETDSQRLDIYVSAKGRSVRVWKNGRELK